VLVFGDDAQTSKRVGQNVKLLLWYSPVAQARKSDERLIPLYLVPTTEVAFLAICKYLNRAVVWSFNAAAANVQPYWTEERHCEKLRFSLMT